MTPDPGMENNGNILVVDDTRENLRLLSDMLSAQGYLVRPVSNGSGAISSARFNPPDLIVLDILMPEMDGYEVCRQLKADERTRDIPIIFVSALHDLFDKVKAFSLGGVDYISKPFEEAEVLARVNTHLTLRRQQQEIQVQYERFQKLADAAFEGILIHDQGEILEVNQMLVKMFGYDYCELIGMNAFDLLEPHSRDIAAAHLTAEGEQPYELHAMKRDGTVFPMEIQARNLSWQGRPVRVVAMRDISWRTVLEQERRTMKITLGDSERFGALVGKSQAMKQVYELILRAAATDASVVIYGETGTGKELTARTIFNLSDHHKACFTPVNCASIPEDLFESQFFGHRRGAFTGANRDHAGYFEQTHGGTLFLDEVGELPLMMQAKLLRVLEDHSYTPVGANTSRTSDVRIIAATNQELRSLVRHKKIRSDFFHRLHVLAIDLPPLRGRKEDIPLLMEHFFQQPPTETSAATIPAALLERFYTYDWPGNVRELFNELQRYLATGEVELAGRLPDESSGEKTGLGLPDDLSLNDAIEQLEHYYIPRTLSRHGGHKTRTADILGVDRKTLYRKLKKYGIL